MKLLWTGQNMSRIQNCINFSARHYMELKPCISDTDIKLLYLGLDEYEKNVQNEVLFKHFKSDCSHVSGFSKHNSTGHI